MRHLQLGRDEINLDKFEVIQLKQQIQNDSINCGVYCLKVSKITVTTRNVISHCHVRWLNNY